jgi:hypothetical protein
MICACTKACDGKKSKVSFFETAVAGIIPFGGQISALAANSYGCSIASLSIPGVFKASELQ